MAMTYSPKASCSSIFGARNMGIQCRSHSPEYMQVYAALQYSQQSGYQPDCPQSIITRIWTGSCWETIMFARWRPACMKVICPSSGKKRLEGSWYFWESSKNRCGRLENQSLKVLTSGKGPSAGIDSKTLSCGVWRLTYPTIQVRKATNAFWIMTGHELTNESFRRMLLDLTRSFHTTARKHLSFPLRLDNPTAA